MEQWVLAHSADSEFQGVPFPSNTFELPSPEILANQLAGTTLETVAEPDSYDQDANTP